MRKITKKRKTKARTKIRKYRTKTNIRKSRKTYKYLLKGGNPLYDETSTKYKQIFGDNFNTILKYANSVHIKKLIKLLKEETEFPSRITFNNNEQIDKILEPALTKFLAYIMNELPIIQTLLTAYNHAKWLKNRFSSSNKEFEPTTLNAEKILSAPVSIPPGVKIDDNVIAHLPGGDKTARKNLIIVLARENKLIDEFIRDLQILGKIETVDADLPAPAPLPPPARSILPPERQSSINPITPSRTQSTSSSASSYESADISPRTSSYESARESPSISPSRSPSTSSPTFIHKSSKATRPSRYPYVKGKLDSITRIFRPRKLTVTKVVGGRNYKTRNKVYSSHKKTRRHKNSNI